MKQEIRITVKLFSDLRQFGPAISTICLPKNATINSLLDNYRIPREKKDLMIFVNGLPHHKVDDLLNDKDVVAIFPPTAGG
jgi:molybdopterin converting factor small subunit